MRLPTITIAAAILFSLAAPSAAAKADCRGDQDERRKCEQERTDRLIARMEAKTKALKGANECARRVLLTSVAVAGASMGVRPEEIPGLVENQRQEMEKRFIAALEKPVELLANILRGLFLVPDDEEYRIVDECLASLKGAGELIIFPIAAVLIAAAFLPTASAWAGDYDWPVVWVIGGYTVQVDASADMPPRGAIASHRWSWGSQSQDSQERIWGLVSHERVCDDAITARRAVARGPENGRTRR